MRCPFCGATDTQERLGELADRPHIVYRCNVCNELYAISKEHEDPGEADSK